jgi:hypothetical protein
MPETPEERAERWILFEQHYGPIAQPPDVEHILEQQALQRFCALFHHVPFDSYRPHGMGQG